MMDEYGLQMRIAVVLAGLMVEIIFLERRELFQPPVDVLDQPFLVVIHVNAGRDVHGRNQCQSVRDAARVDNLFYLRRDVDVFAVLLGVEGQILSVKFHG